MKNFYVICPADLITGGPDALHQMVYYLNKIGYNAQIAYCNAKAEVVQIPAPYKIYVNSYVSLSEIEDLENTIIICPEMFVRLTKRFKLAHIYVWWLSVDNNLKRRSLINKICYLSLLPFRFLLHTKQYLKNGKKIIASRLLDKPYNFKKERENVDHLCASYYAYDYVSKRSSKNVNLCIEPISLSFLNGFVEWSGDSQREDIVLYNPKKSGKQIELLAKYDNTINFVPLKGYDQKGLLNMYKKAKLFVDFGPFPGAERMPKEAVLFGCTIITGKRGASAFYNDVPIPNEYKFDSVEDQKDLICHKIKYCLSNYSAIIADFDAYKNTVLNLESNFIQSIQNIFGIQ